MPSPEALAASKELHAEQWHGMTYDQMVAVGAATIDRHFAALRDDKARLDWLEQHSYRAEPTVPPAVYVIAHSSVWPAAVANQLRQAIDAAAQGKPS